MATNFRETEQAAEKKAAEDKAKKAKTEGKKKTQAGPAPGQDLAQQGGNAGQVERERAEPGPSPGEDRAKSGDGNGSGQEGRQEPTRDEQPQGEPPSAASPAEQHQPATQPDKEQPTNKVPASDPKPGGDTPQDPTSPAPETETPLTPEERVALLEKPFEKGVKGTTKPFFQTLNSDGTVTAHHIGGMATLEQLQQKAGAKEWLENEMGMTVEARAAITAHRESLREQGYTSKQIEEMDDARQRRLGGHDGGPQTGDIWTQADLDRVLKARESEAWRKLTRDPPGTSSQAGTERANEALLAMTPEQRDEFWKAEVLGGGETGKPALDSDSLYGEIYRLDYAASQTGAYEDVLLDANRNLVRLIDDSPSIDRTRMAPQGEYTFEKWVPDPAAYTGPKGDGETEARHWQRQAESYGLNAEISTETGLWKALGRRNLDAPTVDVDAYQAQQELLKGTEWAGDQDHSWLARNYWQGENAPPSWETLSADLNVVGQMPIADQADALKELGDVYRGGGVDVVDPQTSEGITAAGWLETALPAAEESSRRAREFREFTGQDLTYDEAANLRVFWQAAAKVAATEDGGAIFTAEEAQGIRSQDGYWQGIGRKLLGVDGILDRQSYDNAAYQRNVAILKEMGHTVDDDLSHAQVADLARQAVQASAVANLSQPAGQLTEESLETAAFVERFTGTDGTKYLDLPPERQQVLLDGALRSHRAEAIRHLTTLDTAVFVEHFAEVDATEYLEMDPNRQQALVNQAMREYQRKLNDPETAALVEQHTGTDADKYLELSPAEQKVLLAGAFRGYQTQRDRLLNDPETTGLVERFAGVSEAAYLEMDHRAKRSLVTEAVAAYERERDADLKDPATAAFVEKFGGDGVDATEYLEKNHQRQQALIADAMQGFQADIERKGWTASPEEVQASREDLQAASADLLKVQEAADRTPSGEYLTVDQIKRQTQEREAGIQAAEAAYVQAEAAYQEDIGYTPKLQGVAAAQAELDQLQQAIPPSQGGNIARRRFIEGNPEHMAKVAAARRRVEAAQQDLKRWYAANGIDDAPEGPGIGRTALAFIPGASSLMVSSDARKEDSPGGKAITPSERAAITQTVLLDAPGLILAPLFIGGTVPQLARVAVKGTAAVGRGGVKAIDAGITHGAARGFSGSPALMKPPPVAAAVRAQPNRFAVDLARGTGSEFKEEFLEAGWELMVTSSPPDVAFAGAQLAFFAPLDAVDRRLSTGRAITTPDGLVVPDSPRLAAIEQPPLEVVTDPAAADEVLAWPEGQTPPRFAWGFPGGGVIDTANPQSYYRHIARQVTPAQGPEEGAGPPVAGFRPPQPSRLPGPHGMSVGEQREADLRAEIRRQNQPQEPQTQGVTQVLAADPAIPAIHRDVGFTFGPARAGQLGTGVTPTPTPAREAVPEPTTEAASVTARTAATTPTPVPTPARTPAPAPAPIPATIMALAQTPAPVATPSQTVAASVTTTPAFTPTPAPTPAPTAATIPTPVATPSQTVAQSVTQTPALTPAPTTTPTPTPTPQSMPMPAPMRMPRPVLAPMVSPTPTLTLTPTPTPSPSPRPTLPDEGANRRRLTDEEVQGAYPKAVSYLTGQEVTVELETGRETRRPLTGQEVLAFRVTEFGANPHPDRRHIGPVDIVTDDQGRPKAEPRHTHTRERPTAPRRSRSQDLYIPAEVRRLRQRLGGRR